MRIKSAFRTAEGLILLEDRGCSSQVEDNGDQFVKNSIFIYYKNYTISSYLNKNKTN